MSQVETFERKIIYYHPEIIELSHREYCITCDMAYWLMKDIVKSEEIKQ